MTNKPTELVVTASKQSFQARVDLWMDACFGDAIKADKVERCDRFIEEALELVQTEPSFTVDRAHALVDYVFGRNVGEPSQEVGGVKVTLAALCNAFGIDVDTAAETELARVWTKVDAIRAKQAAKPTGSALPVVAPASDKIAYDEKAIDAVQRLLERGKATVDSDGYLVAYPPPASEDEVERVAEIIRENVGGALMLLPEQSQKAARLIIAALRPRSEREEIGRRVTKRGGDYEFDGEVVGVIRKRSGAIRYAVEDDRGLLLIMNAKQVGIDERGDPKEPSE